MIGGFSFSDISPLPKSVISLSIGATNLEHLDIRLCKSLKTLDARDNKLTSILFPDNPETNEIFLSDNNLDDAALAVLD